MSAKTISDAVASINFQQFKQAINRVEGTIGGEHIRINALRFIVRDMMDNNASAFSNSEASAFYLSAMDFLSERYGDQFTEAQIVSGCEKLYAHLYTGATIFPPGVVACRRMTNAVSALLDKFPQININSQNEEGVSLFMLSVGTFNIGVTRIEELLANGADVHLRSEVYGKAIHFVPIELGVTPPKLLEMLIAHGADPCEELPFKYFKTKMDKPVSHKSFYELADAMTSEYAATSSGSSANFTNPIMTMLNQFQNSKQALSSIAAEGVERRRISI